MARSLRAALRARAVASQEQEAVVRGFAMAMQSRIATLDDDHHPAWLHPGRSALILLHDVEHIDPIVVILAALHESVDLALQPPPEDIQELVGASAWETLQSIPMPGSERLVERLLHLGPGLALAALAERLDHVRHLHMRDDLVDLWADTHLEVSEAWLPFAARVHPRLATRYAHWVRTFAKRL
jgi:hypothetical protein